jgi:hypothetical protein
MKIGEWVSILFFFLYFIFIILVSPAMSTTVIAFRTSNEIILAADSLGVWVDTGQNSSVCKITQINNIFITFAGRISARGINMIDIARDAFSSPGTINDKMVRFNAKAMNNLALIVNEDRKNKDLFDRLYNTKDRDILCVIIAVVNDSYPTYFALCYIVASSIDQPALIKEMDLKSISPLKRGYYESIVGGERDAFIKDLPDYNKPLPKSFNIIQNIREWITKEARFVPDKVALPVDILRLSPRHAEWVQHKKECQEINEKELINSIK